MDTLILEIPVPGSARRSPMDLEMLKAMLLAIVSRQFEYAETSARAVQDLEAAGWSVHVGPTWMAVGRRAGAVEEAYGRTPDQAIEKLHQYLKYETGFGCP
jgi:hypothetical protein